MRIVDWNRLDDMARAAVLERPALRDDAALRTAVRRIVEQVRADGDSTLRALTRRYDGCELADFEVDEEEFAAAREAVSSALHAALDAAAARIEAFHRAGMPQPFAFDTAPGVRCERVLRPIERVGLYVPAGTAPLPSTALMLGIPARLAGCPDIVLCTPPRADGRADEAVLVAARRCGIERVLTLGGAQAIAAMAYGSESVARRDKLFGPGNAWVTEAKRQVAMDPQGAAIDLPAGPSEVLVIADAGADAGFVAADLLSQAEHGPDSQVLLLSDSDELLAAVTRQIAQQAAQCRGAKSSIRHCSMRGWCVAPTSRMALEISNRYAPEHLILALREPRRLARCGGERGLGVPGRLCARGARRLLQRHQPRAADLRAARAYSGVSVASFLKQITVQEVTAVRASRPSGLMLSKSRVPRRSRRTSAP